MPLFASSLPCSALPCPALHCTVLLIPMLQQSLGIMLGLGGLAMVDVLALKEGITVAAPENTPLLAIVVIFGR